MPGVPVCPLHPQTKVTINNIYNNGHFTGSQLWKIGSKEYGKVETTFNRSVKIMYDLPWATHRYLIEPLVGSQHVSRILARRYLSFVEKDKCKAALGTHQEGC